MTPYSCGVAIIQKMISISRCPGESFVWSSPRQPGSLLLVRWSSLFFQLSSSVLILFCVSMYNSTFFFQENSSQPIVLVVRGWDEASLVIHEHSWAPRKCSMWHLLHTGIYRTCAAGLAVDEGLPRLLSFLSAVAASSTHVARMSEDKESAFPPLQAPHNKRRWWIPC